MKGDPPMDLTGWLHGIDRQILDGLARLPQTVDHNDAWRANLLSHLTPHGEEETVAVDWALAGIGAIGQPLSELVFTSLILCQGTMPDAEVLDKQVFESYVHIRRNNVA